jgi:hypothetical protein
MREDPYTFFPGRWNGRAAPIAWQRCSPDFTTLDHILWEYLKDRVFMMDFSANVAELRSRVIAACGRSDARVRSV